MAKLDRNITLMLEYELNHYNEYKMRLAAFRNRSVMIGLEDVKTSAFVYRIERTCYIIDSILDTMPKIKYDLVNQVYIHKMYTIKRFAVLNYIDIATAYRWRSEFFNQLAAEFGY